MAEKKTFSLAEAIRGSVGEASIAAMEAVPETGTEGRERIVYLPRISLVADERNFYSMEGIEELARNIELVGILEPLRVQCIPGEAELFRIVSGHRRRAAADWLALHGCDAFEVLPCIVERVGVSEEMQELRLIMANSDTRKMSDADLARQAERVTDLLYRLKEKGYQFPGRMRDYVAEACKVSKTKLSTLKVIEDKLIPELHQLWETGRLNTAKAQRLAQEPEDVQVRLTEIFTAPQITDATEGDVDLWCRHTAEDVAQRKTRPQAEKSEAPETPRNADSFSPDEYLKQRAEEDAILADAALRYLLMQLGEPLRSAKTRQEGIALLKSDFGHAGHASDDIDWDGSPKGLSFRLPHKRKVERTWTEVWDALAVAALRRSAGSAMGRPSRPIAPEDTAPAWRTGEPGRDGLYWCRLDIDDNKVCIQAVYDKILKRFEHLNGVKLDAKVSGWVPLPEEEW